MRHFIPSIKWSFDEPGHKYDRPVRLLVCGAFLRLYAAFAMKVTIAAYIVSATVPVFGRVTKDGITVL